MHEQPSLSSDLREPIERERVERELAELLESTPDGFHGLDAGGTIAWANQAALDLGGHHRDEVVGRNLADLYLDRDVVADMLARLAAGEPVVQRSVRLACKDGTSKLVALHCKGQHADGKLVRSLCFTRDLSDRTLVERDRALLAAIIESSDDAVISKDLNGLITSWNGGAERLFGYTAAEAIGRPVTMLMPPEIANEEPSILARIRAGERIDHFETVRRHKDGTRIDISLTVSPILDGHGRVVGASKVARDITDRRRSEEKVLQAEERYRRLAELLPVGVYACEARGGSITFYNRHAVNVWGIEPEEGSSHERFSRKFRLFRLDGEAIRPEDAPMAVALREGREFRNEEVVVERLDGTRTTLLVNIDRVTDASGKAVGAIAAFLDVTAMKQAEHALREADRRKDEFLATLAHELRNPLAPILFGLEVMRMVTGDPTTADQALGTIERQTKQLIRLVDDLLDVSRITRGRLELRRCRVRLSDVIKTAVETSRPALDQAGHRLRVELPDGPVLLDADPNRLAQVFSNLLNNAAKYTPNGGYVLVRGARDGERVSVSVADTGIGIPAGQQERIFEMFAQVDRPQERGYTGLGVGLTLAKALVEMHGGTIRVESRGSTGSTFVVLLPVATGDPSEEGAGAGAESDGRSVRERRVLVVDDNEDALRSLSTMLRVLGYDVRTAPDGLRAIEVAEDFRPHVVLMDLGMPGMTGYEAARHMRGRPWGAEVSLIALTGWGQEEHKRRTREAGFDHHVVKPVEPAELKRLLTG